MTATLVGHDHAHEIATFGLCLTCEDARPARRTDPAEQLMLDDVVFADSAGGNHAAQMVRLITVVGDERWRSLDTIGELTGDGAKVARARLADLVRPEFGGWAVNSRTASSGVTQYRARRP